MVVSGWLEENFPEYISDSFTAEMEDELDEIARGERGYEKTLGDFYAPFAKAVKSKDKLPKATALGSAPKEFPCPVCGSAMEFKLGKGGVFMSCTRYPECLGARSESGEEIKEAEPIGTHPETGASIFVKTGRFGPYVEMELPAEGKKKPKVKRASVPAGKEPASVTLEDALKYLSLPRELGAYPETGEKIIANVGRFGPYVGRMPQDPKAKPDFRSIKEGDPYTITFSEALALLAQPKKPRGRKAAATKK
jgi:DNA topoisomerase-1